MKYIVYVLLGCVAAAPLLSAAPAENLIFDQAEEKIQQQREELKALGCKPVAMKVSLTSELPYHDDLHDKMFLPQVVSVNRCMPDCGFCGNTYLGKEKGRCVYDPDGVQEKQIFVFYVDMKTGEKMYREVLLKEHTSCMCA